MPAINVTRTDTFEIQRQKINQIGDQIFSITTGGSDLSAGFLKLGDGTRDSPSLAFVSDATLGIYKPDLSTFGFVSNSKKIADYSQSSIINYKDLIVQQNILIDAGTSLVDRGLYYDPGSYTDIVLSGGTGENATVDLIVTEFTGVINNAGSNYNEGNYQDIILTGGTSSGATVSFQVEGIEGTINSGGSGYIPGDYTDIDLTGGSGNGATADITIEGNVIINGNITSPGSGYTQGDYQSVQLLTKPLQTFTVTSLGSPGSRVYQINGVTQDALTLVKGNVYRFDVSNGSNAANPLTFTNLDGSFLNFQNYAVIQKGVAGQAGGFVDLIIKPFAPTETILYASLADPNGGGNISVVDGTVGSYGTNMRADISVNASGNVTTVDIVSDGTDYEDGDILEIFNAEVGGTGSGFEYTLTTPTYEGEITSITVQNNGQDYLVNDILSVDSADLGGFGSGFSFTITSEPGIIQDLNFSTKTTGYSIGDILSLPEEIENIQTNLKGQVFGLTTTLSTATPIVTLTSTTGILSGMLVTVDVVNSTGNVILGTTVSSVDSPTQITLSQNPSVDGPAILNFSSTGDLTEIEVLSVSGIIPNSLVTTSSGPGQLEPNTTVSSIDEDNNTITLSTQPAVAGPATLTFTPPFGVPTNKFEYEITGLGSVESFTISSGGNGYSVNDVLTVNNKDLTQPIVLSVINKELQIITFVDNIPGNVFSVGDIITIDTGGATLAPTAEIYDIKLSGGFVESMLVDSTGFASGDLVTGDSISTPNYEVDTASDTTYRFFIDSGSGYQLTPNLTFYVGNTYNFDLSDSSNSSHRFALSKFRDGIWGPSYIQNVTATLSSSSNQIVLPDTTGILPGMEVTVASGQGLLEIGTVVESVTPTTVVLDKPPVTSGTSVLTFRGTEYLDSVERENNILSIRIIDTTPNLYYYCSINSDIHVDEGGEDNQEALITIDPNNPKVFGSGFSLLVTELLTNNVITADSDTGEITAILFTGNEATVENASITQLLNAPTIVGNNITASTITASNNLVLSGSSVDVSGNFNVGSNFRVVDTNGNLTTSGIIRTNGSLNVNNILTIVDNVITTLSNSDVILTPSAGRVAKINSITAITIPSGTTLERPGVSLAENGSIRFNTDTNQYEGYSATNGSWSSLGGVRDLDGNTTILAEETVGANDNTLWFINDNINTVKFTPTHLEFVNQKSIRSANVNAPSYVNWTANTPVTVGTYLKYRNNLYEVTYDGTTATSGNEPTHTSGAVLNGSAELTFWGLAVAPLTFEDIEVLRIGPQSGTPLSINNDLRLKNNVISTDVSDIIIRPNSGKKIICDAETTFTVPVGPDANRGVPTKGGIRFSETTSQFEGYDGVNWGSLGGVKDVDQNTYIIPELAPGTNENTLFFFNDNSNTLQVTTTALDFYSIDTIRSVTSGEFEITAPLLTIDNGVTTLDNTSVTTTFLHTTKQYFDLGLSSGLTSDPVLRLDDQGDVYLNIGFGTGVFTGVKVFDGDLKEFELADIKILTEKLTLVKGTSDTGSFLIYASSANIGSKTTISAENPTSGDKEFIEFGILDDGTDVFYTEYGNIRTGVQLIVPTFEFTGSGDVKINISLGSGINPTEAVNITVVSNVTKK